MSINDEDDVGSSNSTVSAPHKRSKKQSATRGDASAATATDETVKSKKRKGEGSSDAATQPPQEEQAPKLKKRKTDRGSSHEGGQSEEKASLRRKATKETGAQLLEADEENARVKSPEKPRRKRKSKRRTGAEVSDEDDEDNATVNSLKPKSKHKRSKDVSDEPTMEDRHKEGKEVAVTEGATVEEGAAEHKPKERRRKKNTDSVEYDVEKPTTKKKKRSKPRLDLPDPREDEALTENAAKALTYAYSHLAEPSEWKFSKARQNWLVRNVWSENAIPDRYLELTMKYLSGVQGGAREKLAETCRSILASPASEPAAPDDSAGAEAATANGQPPAVTPSNDIPVLEAKRARAKELLRCLTGADTTIRSSL